MIHIFFGPGFGAIIIMIIKIMIMVNNYAFIPGKCYLLKLLVLFTMGSCDMVTTQKHNWKVKTEHYHSITRNVCRRTQAESPRLKWLLILY